MEPETLGAVNVARGEENRGWQCELLKNRIGELVIGFVAVVKGERDAAIRHCVASIQVIHDLGERQDFVIFCEVAADVFEYGLLGMQTVVQQAAIAVFAQTVESQNGGGATLQAAGNAREASLSKEADGESVSF